MYTLEDLSKVDANKIKIKIVELFYFNIELYQITEDNFKYN